MTAPKISFDRSKCSGHAQCAFLGPDVYELDDDGYLESFPTDVPTDLWEQARGGAKACPERAISLD